jgi:HSP20 family molecular chaperone IbpA
MATQNAMTTTTATPAERREAGTRAPRTIVPRVDLYETDTRFVLLADMPGVTSDGLEVTAERESLTIRGRVDAPERTPDYQEFELGEYYRTFTLTDDLDTDGVTGTLRDGVLTVEIPKSPRVQPKKIPVRTE